ncbi:MAG: hypothetical protein ABUJ98_08775 [Hyphomicrobium sp.]
MTHMMTVQECVDFLNRPENLEPVRAEIRECENRLAQYRATDPAGWAMFERWWEDTHNSTSVPSVRRRR